MRVTRKQTGTQPPALYLHAGGGFLQVPRSLLVMRSTWTRHIQSLCSKAKKLIGLIYHRFYQHSGPTDVFNAGSFTPRICKPSLEHI